MYFRPRFAPLLALAMIAWTSVARPVQAAEGEELLLQVNAPDTALRSNPIIHEVDFSVVVTPPYGCQVLKVWLPIPQSDAAQQISGTSWSTFPLEVKPQISMEPVFGNRFAYFEFHKPQGGQIIRHRFTAKVWELHWQVEPEKVASVAKWPPSFEPFLKTQTLLDDANFEAQLREVVPHRHGPGNDLVRVMNWIDANLTYDHVNASLRADANHALIQRAGHCSDYHGLCATMGRALGFPTRVTYGIALVPKNSPSHCKVEVYLPPHGWVSFDVSETQKLVAAIEQHHDLTREQKNSFTAAARKRLRSGFRENSWLLLTKGTDYQLAPPASEPVRVVRTAYVEADGERLPDPDPANAAKREFAWATLHKYRADKNFPLPFQDISTLTGHVIKSNTSQ